ncbi:hypothetical protein QP774_26035, partial [Escherichia coli]|nr:hypothetical protein [Escherichia coli]
TAGEEALGDDVLKHFAFASEKLGEVRDLADLADSTEDAKKSSEALQKNQALFDGSRVSADAAVQARLEALTAADFTRQ